MNDTVLSDLMTNSGFDEYCANVCIKLVSFDKILDGMVKFLCGSWKQLLPCRLEF